MQSQWIATFAWSKNRRIINMLALLLDDHLKEEACMKYINAKNILPDALVKELQGYMQGGYLYIPANQAQKKRWGEPLWRNWPKNTSCLYTPFGKSFIRNKLAGVAEMQPLLLYAFVLDTD